MACCREKAKHEAGLGSRASRIRAAWTAAIVTIADDLRKGLNSGELFVEYLPTVRLEDAQCVGGEALVRWKRARYVLPAGAFMPLIEDTPLSGTLTYWVIDTIAAELGEWLGTHPEAHIGINVPPEILGRGALEYAANRSGLHAHVGQIVLEIAERGIPDRLGLRALELMAQHGVRIALDDTMLNGANLALLARCNFDMIKLARELTAQLVPCQAAPAWLSGLQSLLHDSSLLQVVAEGVESEHQARTLHAAGVQMAQGHFFSTPLSAPALKDFYVEGRTAQAPSPRA